jgi:hypothetical protein
MFGILAIIGIYTGWKVWIVVTLIVIEILN